jgi:hypothetical protein
VKDKRRIRPHATPRPAKEARPERKPPATNRYLAKKATALRFDYERVPEAHRETVQRAALEIRTRLKRSVEDMIEIGQRLNEIRAILPHGQFEKWIRDEFGMSLATASEFRNVADRFAANIQNLYLLPVSIVRRLAAPSVSDEAIAAVIEAAQGRDRALPFKDAMAIVKPFMPVKERKPKQLAGPVEEPDAIEAEYTVTPVNEFIFPAPALDPEHCAPVIHRDLARKLQDAMVHRIFRVVLNNSERDELLIALTRALEEE